MASLFSGSPQTATSYTTSNTETPKWLQDAIYNQIQWATNTANAPYQPYQLPTVAELSPLQQKAYSQIESNAGAWQPQMNAATTAMQNAINAPGGAAAAQPYLGQAANFTNQATQGSSLATANPYLAQSSEMTNAAAQGSALEQANPYLQTAGQTSVANIGQYMNPYQQNAMDVLAKQGARNLQENLLPAVSDAFIRAGQFGSGRMGEFGNRALRDTQESILNQQAQMANQGYTQALNASASDLARQAQLGSTAGQLSSADLSRQLSAAGQQAQLGQTAGNLSAADLSRLITAGGQEAQIGATAGQLTGADLSRAQSGASAMGALAQQGQSLRSADAAALEAAGASQRGVTQQQLDAAKAQYQEGLNFPKQQLDWLNTQIRGMAPIAPTSTTQSGTTTGATYSASPLSQIASGLALYKGLSNLG
jgi:hypothetical protein